MFSGKVVLNLVMLPLVLVLVAGPVHAVEKRYQRSVHDYNLPDVTLINQNGNKVRLKSIVEPENR